MSEHRPRVQVGERTYAVERPWGVLPEGKTLGLVTDVAVDRDGNVYVYQRSDPLTGPVCAPVTKFDRDGRFLGDLAAGLVADAHHLTATADGRLGLVDRDAHQVLFTDCEGKQLSVLGERNAPVSPFNHPSSVTVAASGDVYVADGYGAGHVHRFDASGKLLRTWGGIGNGRGEFSTPHGICALSDGRIAVGDRENNRVQVFAPDGGFDSEWTGFYHPMDLVQGLDGLVYVSDQVPRLWALTPAGTIVDLCRPVLNGAHGIALDASGRFYLAEINPSRITRLTPL